MKRRLFGGLLLALSGACFVCALNVEDREIAYALFSAASLIFVMAVFSMVSRIVGTSRVTRGAGSD